MYDMITFFFESKTRFALVYKNLVSAITLKINFNDLLEFMQRLNLNEKKLTFAESLVQIKFNI
ncbi:hypothetical protein BpHYR1_022357 [Brachionus plicatilis]|uniref:Uncharacterized protein n=1 Tax=Brachionus plicatilis TaxID=10195 RepID=A0A3M7P786_BRAPC|nr:hypothetical protein BpHYR1_022357 [Brachionus plicatilis]